MFAGNGGEPQSEKAVGPLKRRTFHSFEREVQNGNLAHKTLTESRVFSDFETVKEFFLQGNVAGGFGIDGEEAPQHVKKKGFAETPRTSDELHVTP